MKNNKKNGIIDVAYDDYVFSGKEKANNFKIYKIKNETGEGQLKVYNLFDGIQLTYNDLEIESVYQDIKPKKGIIKIDHCLEGSYEIKVKDSEYYLFGKGDLSILNLGEALFENSRLPMKKYKGLSIFIDIDTAKRTIEEYFPLLHIDLDRIKERFCSKRVYSVINSKHSINDIVKDLYLNEENVRISYLIIKIFELLSQLELIETKDINKIASFSKPVYDASKECYKHLLNNPFDRSSISELSKKYAVSESSLKRCFAYITGSSIGVFKRKQVLEAAAKLLLDDLNISIKEVAETAGYSNQSKFTSAFKSHFGITPTKYRNNQN